MCQKLKNKLLFSRNRFYNRCEFGFAYESATFYQFPRRVAIETFIRYACVYRRIFETIAGLENVSRIEG